MLRQLLMPLAPLVVVVATAGTAEAQSFTLDTQYIPNPPGGGPPTANPKGTYDIPATNNTWRIVVEYGTINAAGGFVVMRVSAGSPVALVTNPLAPVKGNWGPTGIDVINNPPVGMRCRAQLQKFMNAAWVTVGVLDPILQ